MRDFLFEACPDYKEVEHLSLDLAEALYHGLRCGIVHSFSLVDDRDNPPVRRVLLAHRSKTNLRHLRCYCDRRRNPAVDAVILISEDFVKDLKKLTDYLFEEARENTRDGTQLRRNIRGWFKSYPPLGTKMVTVPDER